jgi:SAM-dependent methyltransferase
MDRRAVILEGLNLAGLGLEIGAGYGPLAAGQPGLNVRSLDHLDQAGLIEKYARQGAPTDHIGPVDYVWSGQRYAELVGETRFDWIVASHVIEHVPDLVGFLNQCAEILTPEGVLTLAVPDRRYSFDYYRPESGLRELIDAHVSGRTLSSPGCAAEHFLSLARLDGRDTWDEADRGRPEFVVPFETAENRYRRALDGTYVDVHAWVFTPSSFRLAMEDLHALGLIGLREARFRPTVGCEFFVQLSLAGAGSGLSRLDLAEQAVRERGSAMAEPAAPPSSAPKRRWFRGS